MPQSMQRAACLATASALGSGSTNSLQVLHPLGDRRDRCGRCGRFRGSRSAYSCTLLRGDGVDGLELRQRAAIFDRHDHDEVLQRLRPVGEELARPACCRSPAGGARAGRGGARRRSASDGPCRCRGRWPPSVPVRRRPTTCLRARCLQLDAGQVALLLQRAVGIVDIGDAARHAGGEVAADRAEHARPCRRSYIRSHGRRCLRPPRSRPNCAPRSARRRRPGNRPRPRSRRRGRCCRR